MNGLLGQAVPLHVLEREQETEPVTIQRLNMEDTIALARKRKRSSVLLMSVQKVILFIASEFCFAINTFHHSDFRSSR